MGSTAELLSTHETARRLGVGGPEVYKLIFRGELTAVPDERGILVIPVDELRRYQERAEH